MVQKNDETCLKFESFLSGEKGDTMTTLKKESRKVKMCIVVNYPKTTLTLNNWVLF